MKGVFDWVKTGQNIRKAMEARGLSPDNLAAAMGTGSEYVEKILAGEQFPTALQFVKIADALGTIPRELYEIPWRKWNIAVNTDLMFDAMEFMCDIAAAEGWLHTKSCYTERFYGSL